MICMMDTFYVSVVMVSVLSFSQSLTESQLEGSVTETQGEGSIDFNIQDSFEAVMEHPWITKEFIAILGKF